MLSEPFGGEPKVIDGLQEDLPATAMSNGSTTGLATQNLDVSASLEVAEERKHLDVAVACIDLDEVERRHLTILALIEEALLILRDHERVLQDM